MASERVDRHAEMSANIPKAHAVEFVEAQPKPIRKVGHARRPIECVERLAWSVEQYFRFFHLCPQARFPPLLAGTDINGRWSKRETLSKTVAFVVRTFGLGASNQSIRSQAAPCEMLS